MKVVCVNNKRYEYSLIEGKEYDVLLETGVMGCQRWYINGENHSRLYLLTLLEQNAVLAKQVVRNKKIDILLEV